MINKKIAKFMFKFTRAEFFNIPLLLNQGEKLFIISRRKALHHIGLKVWKNVPIEFRHCPFPTFKNIIKQIPFKL